MYPSEKDKNYFFELLSKYNNGTATPAETEFVERFLAIMEYRRTDALADFDAQKNTIETEVQQQLFDNIRKEHIDPRKEHTHPRKEHVDIGKEHSAPTPITRRIPTPLTRRWTAAAAAVLLLLGTGIYFSVHRRNTLPPPIVTLYEPNDIKPGKQGALLTLSDGQQISLDSLQNGVLTTQGNAEVKISNGSLVYNKKANGVTAMIYNTISTPRGRQFQLILPDGTRVWLNAASSLRYPVTFAGGERKVEISGEAYFEVSPNAHMPFHVKIDNRTEVEVLGTNFNINAYGDETGIKTTLLEGAVKVSSGKQSQLLQPGQQSLVSQTDGTLALLKDADLKEAVAWKNGAFSFNNSSLEAVMRQMARWYDIEVEYTGSLPTGTFSGEIDRSLTLDQVLKGLTKTRIHYRIEKEKKLIILP